MLFVHIRFIVLVAINATKQIVIFRFCVTVSTTIPFPTVTAGIYREIKPVVCFEFSRFPIPFNGVAFSTVG